MNIYRVMCENKDDPDELVDIIVAGRDEREAIAAIIDEAPGYITVEDPILVDVSKRRIIAFQEVW